jgi:hypothetical protein
MQSNYDQSHEKIAFEQLSEKEAARQAAYESNSKDATESEYGTDSFKYPLPEFPVTTTDLDKYNLLVKQKVEKKYVTLIRNVYFYLTYIYLEL